MTSARMRSGRRRRAAARAASPSGTASTSYWAPQQAIDVVTHVGVVVGQEHMGTRGVADSAPRHRGHDRVDDVARQTAPRVRPPAASATLLRRRASHLAWSRRACARNAMRSAGKCAIPVGIVTVNVLPAPGWLTTRHRPVRAASRVPARARARCRCLRACVPECPRRDGTARTRAAVPCRECQHRCRQPPARSNRPACRSDTVMRPASVYLKALETRFRTIFSHMSRSTYIGSRSGGQSTTSSMPARSIADRNALARSAVSAERSVG